MYTDLIGHDVHDLEVLAHYSDRPLSGSSHERVDYYFEDPSGDEDEGAAYCAYCDREGVEDEGLCRSCLDTCDRCQSCDEAMPPGESSDVCESCVYHYAGGYV